MKRKLFWRSLAFAALAALATPVLVFWLQPVLGRAGAIGWWGLGLAVAYLVVLSRTLRQGIALGGLAATLAIVVGMASPHMWVMLSAAALLLAGLRSALLFGGATAAPVPSGGGPFDRSCELRASRCLVLAGWPGYRGMGVLSRPEPVPLACLRGEASFELAGCRSVRTSSKAGHGDTRGARHLNQSGLT